MNTVQPAAAPLAAHSAAPSLVKGSKCPTRHFARWGGKFFRPEPGQKIRGTGRANFGDDRTVGSEWEYITGDNNRTETARHTFFDAQPHTNIHGPHKPPKIRPAPEPGRPDVRGIGTVARLWHRRWSNEYRITCESDAPHQLPPEQAGERITGTLTPRGARAIAESCEYVLAEHGGYTTFLTLTLDDAARARVEAGETIQKQVSRFFDGMQKIYRRGWVPEFYYRKSRKTGQRERLENKAGFKVPGATDALDYAWVIENPLNNAGERNPHIHVLMRWRVPRSLFLAWAARIEALWGQGFAKLEKLRAAESAGYYMAKAAGYMSKGKEGEQGPVKGNRYGLSKSARAPGWVHMHAWAWGIMGNLIGDAGTALRRKSAPIRREIEALKSALKATNKTERNTRQRIGRALMKARKRLGDVGGYASKLQIVIKGRSRLYAFYDWARGKGWTPDKKPDGLWLGTWRRACESRRMAQEYWERQYDQANWDSLLNIGQWHEDWEPVDENDLEFCQ